MINYQQRTPPMRARGFWSLRNPFGVPLTGVYTCVAIRSFKDMYSAGEDPYTLVYEPVGLTNGSTVDGGIFNIRTEELKGINIISLTDRLGNIVHVPDNFILSYPNSTNIQYEHIILSCSLGPLPSSLDTALAEAAVAEQVKNYFGIANPVVKVSRVASTDDPTYEQHLAMEQARIAAIEIDGSAENQIQQLTAKNELLQATVDTMTQILINNNLMPT